MTSEENPSAGAAAEGNQTVARSDFKHTRGSRQRRRSRFSPWGELYAELLRAEARSRRLSHAEYDDLARQRGAEAVQLLTEAREASEERRERVLRHADLAERLRQVLGLSSAARWNGWVPPRTLAADPCDECRRGRPGKRRPQCDDTYHLAPGNDSPIRAEVVEICREAYQREQQVAA